MKVLFLASYIAALLLWIPLAVLAAKEPSMRPRVMVPLVASALAAAYEAFMTFVWSPTVINPIRVDIFLVMFVLGIVDAIGGLSLVISARGRPHGRTLMIAGAFCLGVPALAVPGYAALRLDTAELDRFLALGRKFRFEAYFRDDETEKRVFGELKPGRNPWAGYYVGTGDDDRFAHLVINDDGHFWIYHAKLYVREGKGRQSAESADTFESVGEGRMVMRMALRRQDAGPFLLEVHTEGIPDSPTPRPAPMKKADPPRFPRPPSASDDVRFVGVFSSAYGERHGGFWLIQVWLWESGGEWWGQYLRDHYVRGKVREFISPEKIHPECSEQCNVLSFKSGRGPVTLARDSSGEFTATVDGEYKKVTLKRGETLPGFFLDLAPLATRRENHEWIKAITTARMITWNVPPAAPDAPAPKAEGAGQVSSAEAR